MAGEWAEATVGDAFDLVNGYAFKSADFIDQGVPVIKIKNVKAGEFSAHDFSYVSEDFLKNRSNKLACFGDLLISMSGNRHDGSPETWVGKVAQFRKTNNHFINQRVGALRVKKDVQMDSRFASFLLSSMSYQELFIAIATSSGGQANLSPAQILGAPMRYPPVPEQRAIAHILGTLDDKIELNRRRNQTLEAMARALFKDWFVDFGPVRAKMEGRVRYLPAGLWQLFPDRLDDKGKPEGWRRSTIGSEVTVCGGSTPSTIEPTFWKGGEHHWATPKDLSGLKFPVLLDTDRKITDAGIDKISSGLLPVGTVLLSSRAPIGYLAIAEVPTAINQGFIAMKCDGILPKVFVLFWCGENMNVILGNANGSTFQEISKSNFRPIPVVVPPEPILKAFQERTGPLYRHVVENERESKALAQLRDTLLPKLISGDLRIADAEKFLEGVP
jgi:type I restriction enzyme, S subunit